MPATTQARKWAGTAAIAGVLLFAVANALWAFEQPAPDALGPEILDFYDELSGRIVAGALMSLTSLAIFAVFASALRGVLVEIEGNELLANVMFGGMLFGLASGAGAETINMAAAMRAADGALSEPLALSLFDVSYMFGSYAAAPGFGLANLAIGWVALRSGDLLPRVLALAALAIGLLLVTPLGAFVLGEYVVAPGFLLLLVLGRRLLL